MTQGELYRELHFLNHSREQRVYYAQMIVDNPELIPDLIEILFLIDDPLSKKAGWLLEFVSRNDIGVLLPYLDNFFENLHTVYKDAVLRPVAKICEMIALAYYREENEKVKDAITQKHKSTMIEVGFDWLITDQKVAVKAYTLTTLFLLGTEVQWIHPEMEKIMENDYPNQSAAYKARCRHILKAINQIQKKK